MHGLHYFMAALLSWCLYERLANTTVVFGHVCIALCSLHIDLSFLAIRSAKHSGHMVEWLFIRVQRTQEGWHRVFFLAQFKGFQEIFQTTIKDDPHDVSWNFHVSWLLRIWAAILKELHIAYFLHIGSFYSGLISCQRRTTLFFSVKKLWCWSWNSSSDRGAVFVCIWEVLWNFRCIFVLAKSCKWQESFICYGVCTHASAETACVDRQF